MEHSSNFFTVRQFSKKHPAFSESALRWQIFNEDTYGLKKAGAIVRQGKKVLVVEDRYLKKLYDDNQAA